MFSTGLSLCPKGEVCDAWKPRGWGRVLERPARTDLIQARQFGSVFKTSVIVAGWSLKEQIDGSCMSEQFDGSCMSEQIDGSCVITWFLYDSKCVWVGSIVDDQG
ncbi:hypothetical protein Btru_055153 [Bulinus truncatus]|nr:hypothetical protein Btru_055153 [Bulinus truncatus]